MSVDDQLLASLKRKRAALLAAQADLADVDDEIAAARGESSAKKIRKRAAASVEVPVAEAAVAETAASK